MDRNSAIGLIGLGVMGGNLALNFARNGYLVTVYNHTEVHTHEYMAINGGNEALRAAYTIQELLATLESPRKLFLMIKAGDPVDEMIEQLYPLLDQGDLIIDGGNSYYKDTERRCDYLKSKGILYMGCGVSGGAEGALWGPSMMPGGESEAWPLVREMFQKVAAKAPDGSPCCEWIGNGGAGHYVKMIHNGIEYGDMQLISETYYLLKTLYGVDNRAISELFSTWNDGLLSSYLIEITAKLLLQKEGDAYLIDQILDVAGQKGTGKWSVESAFDQGVPLTVIVEAVAQRDLSAQRDLRVELAALYPMQFESVKFSAEQGRAFEKALYASKLISYAQGFALLARASEASSWELNMAAIASVWRAGCIIRSVFLEPIRDAFKRDPYLPNLLCDLFFQNAIHDSLESWKATVTEALGHGISCPAHASALNYFFNITSDRLPVNMIQAQRDFFGAHTFERTDAPRGSFFHADWNT